MTSPLDDIFQLVREPIDSGTLIRQVRGPEDGAIVTFDGFVRNQSHNRRTLYLDRKSTRLNSSHLKLSRMPSSA